MNKKKKIVNRKHKKDQERVKAKAADLKKNKKAS